jgi:hypothetical protein
MGNAFEKSAFAPYRVFLWTTSDGSRRSETVGLSTKRRWIHRKWVMGDVLQKSLLSPFAVEYIPTRTVLHGLEPFRRPEHGPVTYLL